MTTPTGPIASAGIFGVEIQSGVVWQYVPPDIIKVGEVQPNPKPDDDDDDC